MEPKTHDHLETAVRNRDIAMALIDPSFSIAVQPPPLEWVVVVAFYAAVHYVNAYLWQRQRYEPHDHAARENAVARAAEIRTVYESYARLRGFAYRARYVPLFRISRVHAERALADLDRVERTVLAALNVTT